MEKLMRKCLDSILAQTCQDYECLLIDDGSTDGSPAICDEYAAKDSRFKTFHKPNGGLSDARNYGIEHARGEYTIFFDPDDWVDEDCLKDLYAKALETDADMVMCDIYYNDQYCEKYSKQEPKALDHYSVLKDVINDDVQGFTVIKLIRLSLYKQFNIRYPVGMYGCEDQYTICSLLKNNIVISYLPKAYYHYMHYGNGTQSRRYDEGTFQHDIRIRDLFVELLEDTPFKELAYQKKTYAVFSRAFHFGNTLYSSTSFKKQFAGYHLNLNSEPFLMRFLYKMSLNGFYKQASFFFDICYKLKQYYKKIKAK